MVSPATSVDQGDEAEITIEKSAHTPETEKSATPAANTPECPTPESSESEHDKSPKGALKKSSEWFSEIKKERVPMAPLSPHILNHHLTIGPHGGIDWVRRLGLETASRKSVNGSQLEIGSLPDARRAVSTEDTEEASIRHSTDCIVAAKELSASSDSDLLRSAPPWAQRSKFRFSPDKDAKPSGEKNVSSAEVRRPSAPASSDRSHKSEETARPRAGTDSTSSPAIVRPRVFHEPSTSSAQHTSSSASSGASNAASSAAASSVSVQPSPPQSSAEELAAKKSRVKSSLLKRARSVAIFSLKLKERRARDALAKEAKAASPPSSKTPTLPQQSQQWTGRNPDRVEGELSCIPIEKLISVDDVAVELMRKRTNT